MLVLTYRITTLIADAPFEILLPYWSFSRTLVLLVVSVKLVHGDGDVAELKKASDISTEVATGAAVVDVVVVDVVVVDVEVVVVVVAPSQSVHVPADVQDVLQL